MRYRFPALILLSLLCLLTACHGAVPAEESSDVLIFAAASLRDVLGEIAEPCRVATGLTPVYNFAGSNVLAQQIAAAPRAEVFVSANERWMDHLEEADLLVDGTRRVLLSNQLVVIAPAESSFELREPADLDRADYRFLSLADPEAVPAGIYARAFLEGVAINGTDLWARLRDRVAPAPDVRAALGLVEAHDDVVGVVYRTDAMASRRVRVVYEVPAEIAPPIRYPAAAIRGGDAGRARRLLEFLAGAEAAAIFERHGFVPSGGSKGGRDFLVRSEEEKTAP